MSIVVIPLTGGSIPVGAADVAVGSAVMLPKAILDSSNGRVAVKLTGQLRAGIGGTVRVSLASLRKDGSLEALTRTRLVRAQRPYGAVESAGYVPVRIRGDFVGFQVIGQSKTTAGDILAPTLLLDDGA